MNSFKIDNDEFGVKSIDYRRENDEIYIVINGDDEVYGKLTENDNSKWGWTLNSPNFYFEGSLYCKKSFELELNDSISEYCDFALYMMEHNEVTGKLLVKNGVISIKGETNVMGKAYSLEIIVSIPDNKMKYK